MLSGILDHFYACCPKPLLHRVNDDNWDWSNIPASITGALALEFKVSRRLQGLFLSLSLLRCASYARWDTRPFERMLTKTSTSQSRSFCFTVSNLVEYPRQHNWRIGFMVLDLIFAFCKNQKKSKMQG